jgi:prepilin-type processing-associated H-X9-DG protein
MSLLLAAVQQVRDAAARIKCANNVRQLGLAALQYHDGHGSFPAGLEYQSGPHPMPLSSWLTRLLPYVDQPNLWAATQAAYAQDPNPAHNPPHVGLATVVPLFACPADQRARQVQFAPIDKCNVAFTSYLGVEGKDLTTNDGILFRDSHVSIPQIEDGTSRTLLAGERPPSTNFQFGWWYAGAGQKFTGSAEMVLGVQEQNVLPVTSGSCAPGVYPYGPGRLDNQCDMFHFWSLHKNGANFLFADGAVRFIPYSAAGVLPALASRAGGEAAEFSN